MGARDSSGCDRSYVRVNLHEACDARIAELASQLAEREAEIALMKSKTYCAYCGKEYAIDTDAMLVAEHIATCEKHPMRAVEAKLARLRARTMNPERVQRVVVALESWLAGSHFTIGDPTTVAQKLIAAADFEEWDGED